jgi:hypothetical protein
VEPEGSVKAWLEINRESGVDKRAVSATRGSPVGLADGACPGCGTVPFLIQGHGVEIHSRDVLKSPSTAKCCGDPVGYVYAQADTLFGLEEDFAVLVHGRARVYG